MERGLIKNGSTLNDMTDDKNAPDQVSGQG